MEIQGSGAPLTEPATESTNQTHAPVPRSRSSRATNSQSTLNAADSNDALYFQTQLLDSVHESVIATDLAGKVTYWGRGSEKLYGYTAKEVLGQNVTFIVTEDQQRKEQKRMEHVLETGFWKGEYEQRRKDGSKFWSATTISLVRDANGKPLGFIGIDIDITDRKQQEEELSQLKLAIENAMQGISRLDLQGRFVMVKPHYARMLGYEPQELLGKSWEVTVPTEDIPIATEGYHKMLQDGRASLECRAKRKDGSVFVKQLLLVKRFAPSGERDGHYCFMSDITARKEAEDQLHEKESQLAHVSRLSTMGELVAGIAHEINQPLYAIANFATAAGRTLTQSGTAGELVELNRQIYEQAMKAGDIIRRLRSFVSKSDGNRTDVEIDSVVRDSVKMLAPMMRRVDASIQVIPDDPPVVIPADRVQLEQVLVNLICNALEAVQGCDRREVRIQTRREGSNVHLTVCDTGVGIPKADIDKIFDAFYTTKASGLGMGLAITKTIIESHKGRIWMSPNQPQGAVVHVCLPLQIDD